MTVQFISFDEPRFGHGKGRISSLRDSTDDLYFEPRDITLLGVYIQAGRRGQEMRLSRPRPLGDYMLVDPHQ